MGKRVLLFRWAVGGVGVLAAAAALALLVVGGGASGGASRSGRATSSGRTSSTSPPPAMVVVATTAQHQAIVATYERHVDVVAGDAAIQPGSLHVARLAASGTMWAVAQFEPTAQADAQDQAAGPPFPGGVLPSTPDPLMAIQAGAVTFEQLASGPWRVATDGGVDWPCRGSLPQAVWAVWGLPESTLCLAEHSTPLAEPLPDGSYYGDIIAVQAGTGATGTITFDPETVAANGTDATDRYPFTYRIATGPQTTLETSVGYNPGSASTSDQPWSTSGDQAPAGLGTPSAPTGLRWPCEVIVTGGAATFIKEYTPVTPGGVILPITDEPTSPTDRAPTVVPRSSTAVP